ncbi:hypothetical protein C8R47DRAFT_1032007, partial [Mycena vitilis]
MANPTQFLLPEEQRFNGTNYADFELVFVPGVEGRGFSGYLYGTTTEPTRTAAAASAAADEIPTVYAEPSTPIHSAHPYLEEYKMRSQWLKSTILNNVVNPRSLGLKTDGTPKELWDSIVTGYGTPTIMGRMNAEAELAACKFANFLSDEKPVNAYITAKATAYQNVVNQGVKDELMTYLTSFVTGLTPEFVPIFGLILSSKNRIEAENHVRTFKGVVDQVTGSGTSNAMN